MTDEEHINVIIENTFEILGKVYQGQKEPKNEKEKKEHLSHVGSRIIFPRYRNGETRLSEQELRFIFVEQFNDYCNNHQELHWFYSVETPTEEKYIFSENGKKENKPHRAEEGDEGQAAMFDLVIHDEQLNRIALIEFKALNPDASCFTKDFLKLREEGLGILTYFIMYIKAYRADTISSLNGKIEAPTDNKEYKYKDSKTNLCCYVLDSRKKPNRIEDLIENYPNS